MTYLVALEVEPMAIGQAYDQLPMHCTVMHRFHSTLSPDELASTLEPVFQISQAIELIPQDHRAFGPKKQLVTIVEPTEAVISLHLRIFKALNELGVQYTERDWVGDGYTPHVTDKRGERLSKNNSTSTAYLISVEHPLEGRRRFVHHSFQLG